MGAFNTNKRLYGDPSLIPHISSVMAQEFTNEGYDVTVQDIGYSGKEISITKGGIFKAILGMKTALKIKLTPDNGDTQFDASVGLFGLQAIPTAIALFVTWPVILTQVWGLIQQSKLDDKALEIAERIIYQHSYSH